MVAARHSKRRFLLLRGVALGALIGACFGLVWQAQAQDSAEEYNARGIERYKRGEYDGAISDFNQAIRLNPHDAAAYSNRGNVKIDENEYDQAIVDCDQAIRRRASAVLSDLFLRDATSSSCRRSASRSANRCTLGSAELLLIGGDLRSQWGQGIEIGTSPWPSLTESGRAARFRRLLQFVHNTARDRMS